MIDLIDLLGRDVPGTLTAVQLLMIAGITALWGLAAIADAHAQARAAGRDRWRRWFPLCFEWFLGWFLLLSDGGVYAILGVASVRDPGPLPLWGFVYINICLLFAGGAFVLWGRAKWRGGRS